MSSNFRKRRVDRFRVGEYSWPEMRRTCTHPLAAKGLSMGVQETRGRLHPGGRMPDALLRDGSRLFDHLRGGHPTEIVA